MRTAKSLKVVDETMAGLLTTDVVEGIVDLIPDAWLAENGAIGEAARYRTAYSRYLRDRVKEPRAFVEEAVRAR